MCRIEEAERRDQGGFTLIELLVVVLILAVLAAIAVPAYTNQREKAVAAQLEVALKDMAIFQQSWLIEHHTYATDVTQLVAEGFRYSPDLLTPVIHGGLTSYCLEAHSARSANIQGEFSSELAYPVIVTDDGDADICP